jgi:hypothetical protein
MFFIGKFEKFLNTHIFWRTAFLNTCAPFMVVLLFFWSAPAGDEFTCSLGILVAAVVICVSCKLRAELMVDVAFFSPRSLEFTA